MASIKNPKRVITTYKTACEKKAKAIDEFLATHTELNEEGITELKALNLNLEEQYKRMETGWQDVVGSIEDDALFEALQKMVNDVETHIGKTLTLSKKAISKIEKHFYRKEVL